MAWLASEFELLGTTSHLNLNKLFSRSCCCTWIIWVDMCHKKMFILIVLFLVIAVIQLDDVGISEEETVIIYHRPCIFLKLYTLMRSDKSVAIIHMGK
jgi:hypothetical protein